jgi:putative transposase
VSARTNNKEWFQIPMDECWEIFCSLLGEVEKKYGPIIGSFVLMSNHFHMIIWTPQENLGEIMNFFLREVSKKINFRTGRINHVFGGSYTRTVIDRVEYLDHVYRYVYQNPLVKGLCLKVEDYRYSTLYYLTKGLIFPFKFLDDSIISLSNIPKEKAKRLEWLNQPYNEEQRQIIQKALRKRKFTFSNGWKCKKVLSTFLRD